VRNEEECACSVCLFRCNIFIGFRIIKEMPGLVGSGKAYILNYIKTLLYVSLLLYHLQGNLILRFLKLYNNKIIKIT